MHVCILTETIWTPVTGTAALHLLLSVALEGAAADCDLQSGASDVVAARETQMVRGDSDTSHTHTRSDPPAVLVHGTGGHSKPRRTRHQHSDATGVTAAPSPQHR